ncbi:MAG: hypothetical protein AB8E87_03385 [Prochlorococcus sp.]|nr:hypothetical protein [Prochlorococcaceae cyanobacterium Fu_MAG_50]
MGEFVDIGAGQGSIGLVSGLLSLLTLGFFALLQGVLEDDDDSDSDGGGGGLMQPVA